MKKIVEIDEKRFVALAELGMPVFWNRAGTTMPITKLWVFENRDPSNELKAYIRQTEDPSDKGGFTFWTLVEADGHI